MWQACRRLSPWSLLGGQGVEQGRQIPVQGLAIEVSPAWQGKPFFHRRLPDIGLKEARDIARGARRDVANHTAPLKAKTAKIEAHLLNEVRTFEYVVKQWLTFKSAELVSKSIAGFNGALNNHILPAIGKKPVSEIKLEHITTIITELRRQASH